jgi:hypothetical protein
MTWDTVVRKLATGTLLKIPLDNGDVITEIAKKIGVTDEAVFNAISVFSLPVTREGRAKMFGSVSQPEQGTVKIQAMKLIENTAIMVFAAMPTSDGEVVMYAIEVVRDA